MRGRGGVCRNCRFGLAIQGVLDRKPKFLPTKLSLRVTFKKANAMYPPPRGQIKPGSCPAWSP